MDDADDAIVLFSDDDGPKLWSAGTVFEKISEPIKDSIYRWWERI